MLDYDHLRIRALELLREDWRSPSELARELHIDIQDARALMADLERHGLVFLDGPTVIAREGMI